MPHRKELEFRLLTFKQKVYIYFKNEMRNLQSSETTTFFESSTFRNSNLLNIRNFKLITKNNWERIKLNMHIYES
jgi:hypothetical protein